MDALKAVIGAKRKQAQEELGGRKFAKRSQIENARLTQLREEEVQERAEQASMDLCVGLCNSSSAACRKLPLVGACQRCRCGTGAPATAFRLPVLMVQEAHAGAGTCPSNT